jgi:hypothetical protein
MLLETGGVTGVTGVTGLVMLQASVEGCAWMGLCARSADLTIPNPDRFLLSGWQRPSVLCCWLLLGAPWALKVATTLAWPCRFLLTAAS